MEEYVKNYFDAEYNLLHDILGRKTAFLSQAFGALDFAMETVNSWEEEAELIDLWNDEWKARLEEKVYEVSFN